MVQHRVAVMVASTVVPQVEWTAEQMVAMKVVALVRCMAVRLEQLMVAVKAVLKGCYLASATACLLDTQMAV